MSSTRRGRAMRMHGLVRKEFLQVVRDPSSIAIAFVMPAILLALFGYGVSLDAEHVPVAVVVEDPGADAADFVAAFANSRYFRTFPMHNFRDAEDALMRGRVNGIIRLRDNFARRLHGRGDAPVQVIVNGVDANTGRLIVGYAQGTWSNWLVQRAERLGQQETPSVSIEQRIWFNSEVRSRNFLVPGLIAMIMTLIGALLTALVMSREWERGTMEALMITPVRVSEILLGKLVAYFLLGTGGMLLSVAMGVWLFGVPLRGSMCVLFGTASLFMLAALGMGLLISTVTKNQFVSAQVAILTTFLPAFMLSGFIFDINSMPWPVRLITRLVAARYFVAIVQTVFLAGNVWSVILPNTLALAVMAAIFLGLTWRLSRKRLE